MHKKPIEYAHIVPYLLVSGIALLTGIYLINPTNRITHEYFVLVVLLFGLSVISFIVLLIADINAHIRNTHNHKRNP
ncbi:MAG: hypothetical protein RSC43_00970 [Clostridia bacterium]